MQTVRTLSFFVALLWPALLCLSQNVSSFSGSVGSVGLGPVVNPNSTQYSEPQKLSLCPQMQPMPDGTVFDMSLLMPWASIDILYPRAAVPTQPPETLGLETTGAPPEAASGAVLFPGVDVTTGPPPKKAQTYLPSDEVCIGGHCYTKNAVWSAQLFMNPFKTWPWNAWPVNWFSFKNERLLKTPDGKLIAVFRYAGYMGIPYFLDTSAEVLSCTGSLVGRVIWKFDWGKVFTGQFLNLGDARIQDQDGNDVGKMVPAKVSDSWWDFQETIKIVTSSGGLPYATMASKWGGVGLFKSSVTIAMSTNPSVAGQLGLPATSPYFVCLAFAQQLSYGMYLGPLFTLVISAIFWVAVFICCCPLLFGSCRRTSGREVAPTATPAETQSLLESDKKKSSMFACCSRSGPEQKTHSGQPPTLFSSAMTSFRSGSKS